MFDVVAALLTMFFFALRAYGGQRVRTTLSSDHTEAE